MDALHRVEKYTTVRNDQRLKFLADGREGKFDTDLRHAFTASDTLRRAIDIGMAIMEKDEDSIEDYLGPLIEDRLIRILAAGISDPDALKILRRVADQAEPDFG